MKSQDSCSLLAPKAQTLDTLLPCKNCPDDGGLCLSKASAPTQDSSTKGRFRLEDSPTTCPPFSWWWLASILGPGRSGPCRCHLLQRSNPPSPWWSNSPLRRWEPRKERVVETPPGLGIPSKSRPKSRLWNIYVYIYIYIWSRCVCLYIYINLKSGIGRDLPSFRFGLRSLCIDAELNGLMNHALLHQPMMGDRWRTYIFWVLHAVICESASDPRFSTITGLCEKLTCFKL